MQLGGPFFMYYERNSLSYRKCIPITRQSMVCVHLTNWSIIRKKCRKFSENTFIKKKCKMCNSMGQCSLFAWCVKVFEYFFNTVALRGQWSDQKIWKTLTFVFYPQRHDYLLQIRHLKWYFLEFQSSVVSVHSAFRVSIDDVQKFLLLKSFLWIRF